MSADAVEHWQQLTEEQQMALIFSTMTPVERANFKARRVRVERSRADDPMPNANRSQRRQAVRAAKRSRNR